MKLSAQKNLLQAISLTEKRQSQFTVESLRTKRRFGKIKTEKVKAVIREAVTTDLLFVKNLMNEALSPYYGGDHLAHADRIFGTHISGGRDALGFFSTEQKMFIATLDDELVGMIHLVGKRQGTYKISPLIVAPAHQGKQGIGSQLLAYAEKYAREHDATQLYCTVARENESALQFFIRRGFILAGDSASHYKDGITEVMLYKPLLDAAQERKLDAPNISVGPAESVHFDSIRRILLDILPRYFRDIDDEWVDSLFKGYERRHTADVNQKFKLLYAATDRSGAVLGVAGATPKKGEPIKVMPFIGIEPAAFIALLVEIPHLLKRYGRKLYVHIVPTAEQTIVLQQHGWKLDAALPAAYHQDQVTQQWSLDLDEKFTMRTMRVKQLYLDLIAENRKTLEVRVGYRSIKSIEKGERIRLMSHNRAEIIRVKDVRHYPNFDQMLVHEDTSKIVPGSSRSEVEALLRQIYPPDRERLGVVVLDISTETKPSYVEQKA